MVSNADLWMLPIIKSISVHNKERIILFTRKETSAKLLLDRENYIEEIIYLPFRKGIFQILFSEGEIKHIQERGSRGHDRRKIINTPDRAGAKH